MKNTTTKSKDFYPIMSYRGELICQPYCLENLHKMADELGINSNAFHKNHYKVDRKDFKDFLTVCTSTIAEIIKNPRYGHIVISEWMEMDINPCGEETRCKYARPKEIARVGSGNYSPSDVTYD